MSSKEEDKNKQTGTPRQQKNLKEDRELARQRAEAKSSEVGKLQPLGSKKSSLVLVSPELSYAKKSQSGNKSEPKSKEEEEGEKGLEEKDEEEEDGDEEEEEDKKRNDGDSSNNSPMTALQVLQPFNLDLTHALTVVCRFGRNSNPIKAIHEFGLTTFDDF